MRSGDLVKARIFKMSLKQALWSDQKRRSCIEMSECIFILALEAVNTAKANPGAVGLKLTACPANLSSGSTTNLTVFDRGQVLQ
jgi:hypothetical protein